MTSTAVGLVALVCIFAGGLVGMFLRAVLPEHHLSHDTRNVVGLAAGTVSVLTALVISSLLTSAREAFELKMQEVQELSANLVLLDRVVAHYGPETAPTRDLLRRYTAQRIELTWPEEDGRKAVLDDSGALAMLEGIQDQLRALTPTNEAQHWLQSRALQVSGNVAQARWLLVVQTGSVIPRPFLIVVVFWLAVLFASFGLFAPGNPTVIVILFIAALSVAGAIVLILEMEGAFDGMIRISAEPMRSALTRMGSA
jgi:hypothetical protein